MSDDLLGKVKRKLCITYVDDDTDNKVKDIMANAEQELVDLLGIDDARFSFEAPGTENMLYLAWCYYDWNNCIDDFEVNYASQIARCRQKWMVKQYAQEQKAAAPDL